MMWPLDLPLHSFRPQTMSARARTGRAPVNRVAMRCGWLPGVAGVAALWLAGPAYAGDVDGGGKLIGTFQTRAAPTAPGVVRDADEAREPNSFDGRAIARGAGSSGRRNFLTGEQAVSHAADDTFRRDAGDRIFFGSGSAEIGTRARSVLAAQAEWLKRNSKLRLTIEGHADDGGTADQNIKLSAERAEAVRERLVAEGVEPRRIAVVARGREDRIAVCSDPGCMAQNRRTVTVVHESGAGERIGFDRQRAAPGAPQAPLDADGSRKGPVPR